MDDEAWLDNVLPLDPRAAARVISRAEALREVGADAIDYRCRSGRWLRLAPAVYLTEPPGTPWDRVHAAALHGGPGCAISAAAALAALGFRGVCPPSRVLVLVPTSSGVASWGAIHVRRTARPPHPRRYHDVPLAPVARSVADHVVTLHRLDHVQAIVAGAVQRRLCTVGELIVELEAGPRRGSRLFREALQDVGYGAHSAPEAMAGRLLRRAEIIGFRQNAEIYVRARRLVADFLWDELRAVLEIDSSEYHLTPEDHDATLARDQVLQAAGDVVLHVKPSQLRRPERFVQIVQDWLAALARRSA
jgi:very-short-patch-repair endonuclease